MSFVGGGMVGVPTSEPIPTSSTVERMRSHPIEPTPYEQLSLSAPELPKALQRLPSEESQIELLTAGEFQTFALAARENRLVTSSQVIAEGFSVYTVFAPLDYGMLYRYSPEDLRENLAFVYGIVDDTTLYYAGTSIPRFQMCYLMHKVSWQGICRMLEGSV